LIDNSTIRDNPAVAAAASQLRQAYLARQRSSVLSPISGYVAKRSVQLGQRVAPGTPMMAIIPLDQVWVDANFKEVQLRNIRLGQPVKLTADVYGKKVEYTGKVAGLGVGTGAAFALLPAQNATGNWIKVVQRVPVRVALDASQLKDNPLRVGLSMDAVVDISDKNGKTLAEAPRDGALAQTQVYSTKDAGAEREVQRIISANLGRAVRAGQDEGKSAAASAGAHKVAAAGAGAAVAAH